MRIESKSSQAPDVSPKAVADLVSELTIATAGDAMSSSIDITVKYEMFVSK